MSIISFKNTVIGTEEVNSVNARELHKVIQAKQHFADWIRNRIKKYGFEENQDYIVVTEHTQGRPLKEYYITLDMAKELAMVENNEQGRKIRRYFIEVEKEFRAKKSPDLLELEQENIQLRETIAKLAKSKQYEKQLAVAKQIEDENKMLRRHIVKIHDLWYETQKEINGLYSTLQLMSNGDGKNLQSQTKRRKENPLPFQRA